MKLIEAVNLMTNVTLKKMGMKNKMNPGSVKASIRKALPDQFSGFTN